MHHGVHAEEEDETSRREGSISARRSSVVSREDRVVDPGMEFEGGPLDPRNEGLRRKIWGLLLLWALIEIFFLALKFIFESLNKSHVGVALT